MFLEFGIYLNAMFQIVNPERDGFGEGDGTKMSCDLDAMFMRLLDGGAEFLARQGVVGLERRDASRHPKIDCVARLLWTLHLVKPRNESVFAFEVRAGDPHL